MNRAMSAVLSVPIMVHSNCRREFKTAIHGELHLSAIQIWQVGLIIII